MGPLQLLLFATQQYLGLGDMAQSLAILRYPGQVVATIARHTLAAGDPQKSHRRPLPRRPIRKSSPVGIPLVDLGLPVDFCLLEAKRTVHLPQFAVDFEYRI